MSFSVKFTRYVNKFKAVPTAASNSTIAVAADIPVLDVPTVIVTAPSSSTIAVDADIPVLDDETDTTTDPFFEVHKILEQHIQIKKQSIHALPLQQSPSFAVSDLKVIHRMDADYQGQCAEFIDADFQAQCEELMSATKEFRIEDTEEYDWLFNEVEAEGLELEVPLPAPRRPSKTAVDTVTSRQRKRFGVVFQF